MEKSSELIAFSAHISLLTSLLQTCARVEYFSSSLSLKVGSFYSWALFFNFVVDYFFLLYKGQIIFSFCSWELFPFCSWLLFFFFLFKGRIMHIDIAAGWTLERLITLVTSRLVICLKSPAMDDLAGWWNWKTKHYHKRITDPSIEYFWPNFSLTVKKGDL